MRSTVVTRTRISACIPPVAPVGSRVQILIAAKLLEPGSQGSGYRIDYMGTRFSIPRACITASIDRSDDLIQVTLDATILSRKGYVSYVVNCQGTRLLVHRQFIVQVLEAEVVL